MFSYITTLLTFFGEAVELRILLGIKLRRLRRLNFSQVSISRMPESYDPKLTSFIQSRNPKASPVSRSPHWNLTFMIQAQNHQRFNIPQYFLMSKGLKKY